jgi:hypothetical protein
MNANARGEQVTVYRPCEHGFRSQIVSRDCIDALAQAGRDHHGGARGLFWRAARDEHKRKIAASQMRAVKASKAHEGALWPEVTIDSARSLVKRFTSGPKGVLP